MHRPPVPGRRCNAWRIFQRCCGHRISVYCLGVIAFAFLLTVGMLILHAPGTAEDSPPKRLVSSLMENGLPRLADPVAIPKPEWIGRRRDRSIRTSWYRRPFRMSTAFLHVGGGDVTLHTPLSEEPVFDFAEIELRLPSAADSLQRAADWTEDFLHRSIHRWAQTQGGMFRQGNTSPLRPLTEEESLLQLCLASSRFRQSTLWRRDRAFRSRPFEPNASMATIAFPATVGAHAHRIGACGSGDDGAGSQPVGRHFSFAPSLARAIDSLGTREPDLYFVPAREGEGEGEGEGEKEEGDGTSLWEWSTEPNLLEASLRQMAEFLAGMVDTSPSQATVPSHLWKWAKTVLSGGAQPLARPPRIFPTQMREEYCVEPRGGKNTRGFTGRLRVTPATCPIWVERARQVQADKAVDPPGQIVRLRFPVLRAPLSHSLLGDSFVSDDRRNRPKTLSLDEAATVLPSNLPANHSALLSCGEPATIGPAAQAAKPPSFLRSQPRRRSFPGTPSSRTSDRSSKGIIASSRLLASPVADTLAERALFQHPDFVPVRIHIWEPAALVRLHQAVLKAPKWYGNCYRDMWSGDYAFPRLLRSHWSYEPDPGKADFFYVPLLPSCVFHMSQSSSWQQSYMSQVLQLLESSSLWTRRHGRDFVFPSWHDTVRFFPANIQANSVFLATGSERSLCFDAYRHIAVPPRSLRFQRHEGGSLLTAAMLRAAALQHMPRRDRFRFTSWWTQVNQTVRDAYIDRGNRIRASRDAGVPLLPESQPAPPPLPFLDPAPQDLSIWDAAAAAEFVVRGGSDSVQRGGDIACQTPAVEAPHAFARPQCAVDLTDALDIVASFVGQTRHGEPNYDPDLVRNRLSDTFQSAYREESADGARENQCPRIPALQQNVSCAAYGPPRLGYTARRPDFLVIPTREVPQVWLDDADMFLGNIMALQSKFCLAPAGYRWWSPRYVEAIQTGCVPVLFTTPRIRKMRKMQLPFEHWLPWETFALHVRPTFANIRRLPVLLRRLAQSQFLPMLRRNSRRVWSAFSFRDGLTATRSHREFVVEDASKTNQSDPVSQDRDDIEEEDGFPFFSDEDLDGFAAATVIDDVEDVLARLVSFAQADGADTTRRDTEWLRWLRHIRTSRRQIRESRGMEPAADEGQSRPGPRPDPYAWQGERWQRSSALDFIAAELGRKLQQRDEPPRLESEAICRQEPIPTDNNDVKKFDQWWAWPPCQHANDRR